jgi:hypothetical protein
MKNKLLLTSALVGSLAFAGSSFAEIKGNIQNTISFGSDEGPATGNRSDQRIGTEVNLAFSNKVDLNNGMYASVNGAIEFDNTSTVGADNDTEFEVQIGTAAAYIGIGSDGGNNISSNALPYIGFVPSTLATNVSGYDVGSNDFGATGDEANDQAHISLNAKVAGGVASVVYAPSLSSDSDDNGVVNGSAAGSVLAFHYKGTPVEGLTVQFGQNVISQNTESLSTTASDEIKTTRIGASYNFGKFAIGAERLKEDAGAMTADILGEAPSGTIMAYAGTYAVTDKITLELAHSVKEDDTPGNSAKPDEKITALSVGYNLGGMSVIGSFVDAKDLQNEQNQDAQGITIRTKMAF